MIKACQIKVTRTETSSSSNTMLAGSEDRRSIRLQEKEELMELNDRLASYIEVVRNLENENVSLQSIVDNYSVSHESTIKDLKTMYNAELEMVRRNLDDVSTDRARLEIELNGQKSRRTELERDLEMKDRTIKELNGRVCELEAKIAQFNSANASLSSEIDKCSRELSASNKIRDELSVKIDKIQKQLEAEALGRVAAENRNVTLNEELEFIREISEQEISKVKRAAEEVANLSARMESIGSDEKTLNNCLITEQLQMVRYETADKIEQMRIEIDSNYRRKLEDLEQRLSHNTASLQHQKNELEHCRRRICELCTDRDHLSARLSSKERSLNEAEERNLRDREHFEGQMSLLEGKLTNTKREYEMLSDDYNELMDLKVTMDQEIETYRRLVESEEERLNIGGASAQSGDGGGSVSRKRRRLDDDCPNRLDLGSRSLSVRFSTSSEQSGPIAIIEKDEPHVKSNVIILRNTSASTVSIGGWTLSVTWSEAAPDGSTTTKEMTSTVEYKFPRNTTLHSGCEVHVYSYDVCGVVHEPNRGVFVMQKGKRWPSADACTKCTTRLINLDNEQMAFKETIDSEGGSDGGDAEPGDTRRHRPLSKSGSLVREGSGKQPHQKGDGDGKKDSSSGSGRNLASKLFGIFSLL